MDNTAEVYHVPECHKQLDNLLDVDSYKSELFDGFATHVVESGDAASRVGNGVIYANIYPNLAFNRYGKSKSMCWDFSSCSFECGRPIQSVQVFEELCRNLILFIYG